mmetsp:Transcript_21006/g.23420  ORF Transcript_21006/g.23420 Transcript_21006/m.23420 type:complete len:208 (+) Transcript_21006:66-689(+)
MQVATDVIPTDIWQFVFVRVADVNTLIRFAQTNRYFRKLLTTVPAFWRRVCSARFTTAFEFITEDKQKKQVPHFWKSSHDQFASTAAICPQKGLEWGFNDPGNRVVLTLDRECSCSLQIRSINTSGDSQLSKYGYWYFNNGKLVLQFRKKNSKFSYPRKFANSAYCFFPIKETFKIKVSAEDFEARNFDNITLNYNLLRLPYMAKRC